MQQEFDDHTFDFVVDKGTLDALLSSDDKQLAQQQATAMVEEIGRVTNVGGTLLTISCTDPKEWASGLQLHTHFRPFQEQRISVKQKHKIIAVFLQTWKRTNKAVDKL